MLGLKLNHISKLGCWQLVAVDYEINPLCVVTKLIWFNTVYIMVADALAPCVARTSAPMILTI